MTPPDGGLVLHRYYRGEHGSIALFFAAIILPLLLFLLSISFDLRAVLHEKDRVQRLLDTAGIHGYRFMHSDRAAKGIQSAALAVRAYLSHYPDINANTTVSEVEGKFLDIEYRGKVPLHFADLFFRLSPQNEGPSDLSLPVNVFSRTRGTVFDSVIAVDRSYYLASAPAPGQNTGAAAPDWFASVPMDWQAAQERCFNPAFSSLKNAASGLFASLQRSKMNNVSVLLFPAPQRSAFIARTPNATAGLPEMPFEENGIAAFTPVESRFCAAVAERAQDILLYFPERRESVDPAAGKPMMINSATWLYDSAYNSHLLGSEVLWSRATLSQALEPDIADVTDTAFSLALSEANRRTDRGNLEGRTVKTIFILAGDVPRRNAIRFPDREFDESGIVVPLRRSFESYRKLVSAWNSTNGNAPLYLELFYVLNPAPALRGPEFDHRVLQYRAFLQQETLLSNQTTPYFRAELVLIEDLDSAARDLSPAIGAMLLTRKSGVIAR